MESETLPPSSRLSVDRRDDDRPTRCLLVEINSCHEHMGDERRADTKTSAASVNGETTNQEGRNWIGSPLGEIARRSRTIDRRHRETGVGNNFSTIAGDDPGGCRIPAPVLTGIPSKPLIEGRLAGIEAGAVVTSWIEQLWTT